MKQKFRQMLPIMFVIGITVFTSCLLYYEIFKLAIYNGQANYCIINVTDVNYIVDNWYKELGNAFETQDKKSLNGYKNLDLKSEFKNNKTNVIVFESKTTGQPIYGYYMPISLFNWSFLLFIQESVAFKNLLYIKTFLVFAGIVEVVLLIFYFFWNIIKINHLEKSKIETERQLENSSMLIQCVTELSSDKDIHISIKNLLKIISQYFKSDHTYILEIDSENDTLRSTYEYTKDNIVPQINNLQKELISELSKWMQNYKKAQLNENYASMQEKLNDCIIFNKKDIAKCMVVPLYKDKTIIGFLGMDNPKRYYKDTTLLSSVQFFVTSSLFKHKQQEQLKYMGYKDMLTLLYNRNKYIQIMELYKECILKNTGVIYLDLNGLKKINDLYSHKAGDKYICDASKIISEIFVDEGYRIGGDEFVVLSMGIDKQEFDDKIKKLHEEMYKEKISISIGFLWQETCDNLKLMIEKVEQHMYKEKEAYYVTHSR